MAAEREDTPIEQIQKLKQFLPERSKEEMAQILAYWEKMKAEWERKKKEFWDKHDRDYFKKLLRYKWENKEEIEKKYEYLGNMKRLEREKFIEEYLYDDMLYDDTLCGEKIDEKCKIGETPYIWYSSEEWIFDVKIFKKWIDDLTKKLQPWMWIYLDSIKNFWEEWIKVLTQALRSCLQPCMYIALRYNKIWAEWVKVLAETWKDRLQPWISFSLDANNMWLEWIKVLTQARRNCLQPWMHIGLWSNWIWDKWMKILVETRKNSLQPWMEIDLTYNKIWDEWVQYLIDCMELKGWVKINLSVNNFSDEMKVKLEEWEKSYHNRWINCEIKI